MILDLILAIVAAKIILFGLGLVVMIVVAINS